MTTPQRVAMADVRKGVDMYNKTGVRVLGLVQNMSSFLCSNCGHKTHMFGEDGARIMAEELDIRLLGDIPMDPLLVTSGDSGVPVLVSHPDSSVSQVYKDIATKICSQK